MLVGQGFSFATAKEIVRRMVVNAGKMVGSGATVSVTLAAQFVRITVRFRVIELVKVILLAVPSRIGQPITEWERSIARKAPYFIICIQSQNEMSHSGMGAYVCHPIP
jgi:hypothetical protein